MKRILTNQLSNHAGEQVLVKGWVNRIRDMGGVHFLVLRDRTGTVQVVIEGGGLFNVALKPETALSVVGQVTVEPRAPSGIELRAEKIEMLSFPAEDLPFAVSQGATLRAGLDLIFNHRALSLRHPRLTAVFRIQAEIVHAFRTFLREQGFTEVHTPKIVAAGTEGGAELFPVRYFERSAYLAQSPQFYKQMLVGAGMERVFEVGHAYRAESHDTSRHLNEYVSLDLEMGFIDGVEDVMAVENKLLAFLVEHLAKNCAREVSLLGATLPIVGQIPRVPLFEAQAAIKERHGKESPRGNLDPEGERLVSRWIEETRGSEWVFITHYLVTERPFYAMPASGEPELTESFDLLFRGLEVTTGGQRIHDYRRLVASICRFGLDPGDFEFYLDAFKYGMPPHGGLAIGLERLTMQLCGLDNVREASLFPRDRNRLTP